MPAGRGRKRGRGSEADESSTKRGKVVVHHRSHNTEPGVVLMVGDGDTGQLGLGEDIMERGRPTLVPMDGKFVQVCCGGMHTVCLSSSGDVYTFGCNDEGALGRITTEEGSETVPGRVDVSGTVVQVSAGDSHSAALCQDGRLFIWGNFRDANGSIGLTEAGIEKTPVQILHNHTIVKIVSGGDHLVCLTEQGDVYTAGCAEQGQLGRLKECFSQRGGRKGLGELQIPSIVRCLRHKTRRRAFFSDIWAGQYATYAQEKETGDMYAWGLNNYYQLGYKSIESRYLPERVSSFAEEGKTWLSIVGGQHHAVCLNSDGKVFTVGRSEYGRLGLGEPCTEKNEPTLVPELKEKVCVGIGAGQSCSFAVLDNGDAYSWGMGTNRQLATASEDDEWAPVQMKGKQLENRKVLMVSSGGQHTAMLAQDRAESKTE